MMPYTETLFKEKDGREVWRRVMDNPAEEEVVFFVGKERSTIVGGPHYTPEQPVYKSETEALAWLEASR